MNAKEIKELIYPLINHNNAYSTLVLATPASSPAHLYLLLVIFIRIEKIIIQFQIIK